MRSTMHRIAAVSSITVLSGGAVLLAGCTNEFASQPSAPLGSIAMTNNVLDTNISVDTSRKLVGEASESVLFGFIQLTSPVRCAVNVMYSEGDRAGAQLDGRMQRIRAAAAYSAAYGKADILVAPQWSVTQEDSLFVTKYTARVTGYPGTIRSITDNAALSHLPVSAVDAYNRQTSDADRDCCRPPKPMPTKPSPGAVSEPPAADPIAAAAGDTVRYHYTCSLENGTTVFDSRGKGEARSRVAGGADAPTGLGKALVGVRPGEHRRVVLPPADGFGAEGAPQLGIPPDATVVFDVYVDDVVKH